MKKLKRLAAVLLAGIMALALFTACSDSDPGNPEFDAKVESAYLDALNKTFGTSFENDADIKRLAIEHIEEKHGADGKGYVPLFYEAAKTAAIKANSTNVQALLRTVNEEIANAKKNGRTLELTALGVGAKTIGGKTYVAIGFELTNTTP